MGVRCLTVSQLVEKIEAGNQEFLKRVYAADVVLKDIRPAQEVIPILADASTKTVLVSGPPLPSSALKKPAKLCGALRGSVMGSILFEGWATTADEALKMIDSGES